MVQKRVCFRCGKELNKNQVKYCCNSCRALACAKRAITEVRICPICGIQFIVPVVSGKQTCSRKCGNILAGQKRVGLVRSAETRILLSKNWEKFHLKNPERYKEVVKNCSDRMKENNPSSHPETVEKMKSTKRMNGTLHIWKGERGGNGHLTEPQVLLSVALGWPTEIAIPTGCYRGKGGYPPNYKVDIGNVALKLAIEVDGKGHNSKEGRLKDKKKEDKLKQLGWQVLRFTNEEVMTNLSEVLLTIKKKIKGM